MTKKDQFVIQQTNYLIFYKEASNKLKTENWGICVSFNLKFLKKPLLFSFLYLTFCKFSQIGGGIIKSAIFFPLPCGIFFVQLECMLCTLFFLRTQSTLCRLPLVAHHNLKSPHCSTLFYKEPRLWTPQILMCHKWQSAEGPPRNMVIQTSQFGEFRVEIMNILFHHHYLAATAFK